MTAVLTAQQVADMLGYKVRRVHELARMGKIPGPIDPTVSTVLWRWSPAVLDEYVNGQWDAA